MGEADRVDVAVAVGLGVGLGEEVGVQELVGETEGVGVMEGVTDLVTGTKEEDAVRVGLREGAEEAEMEMVELREGDVA